MLKYIGKLFGKNKQAAKFDTIPVSEKVNLQFETPVKRYTKSELAALYNRSVPTLMSWINHNDRLRTELLKHGYRKSLKEFRKEHVKLIFAYLGEP